MSAAPRTIQTTAGGRNLGAALFAVLLAVVLVALLAISQLTAAKQQAAPAAGTAPSTWDHGTSSAASAIGAATGPATWDHGTSAASSVTGAAAPTWDHGTSSTSSTRVLRVSGTNGGGILYTGIPYPATGGTSAQTSGDAGPASSHANTASHGRYAQ